MQYDKNDPEVTKIMGILIAQMILSGELKFLTTFGRSVAYARKESPITDGISQEKSDKFADAAIATAVAILLEFAPNPDACCRLALDKGEDAKVSQAMENLGKMLGDKKVAEA